MWRSSLKTKGKTEKNFRGYEAFVLSHGGTEVYMLWTLISRKLGLELVPELVDPELPEPGT
jgi:hypothetical protein